MSEHISLQEDRVSLHTPSIIVLPPGPAALAVLECEERYVSPSLTKVYPFVADHGDGCYLWDVDGNCYLDWNAGIAVNNLGHHHVRINAIMAEQAGKLVHYSSADFSYPEYSALCEELATLAPGESPKKVFLSNSGAESVECAMKLARYHTKRPYLVAYYGAFHGRTCGALSLTASRQTQRTGFNPSIPGNVYHLPYPDTYRGIDCDELDHLDDRLFRMVSPKEVAGIIIEPVQGEGGYLIPPAWYMQKLRRLCDEHGILLIADEVQTGMGRTGRFFAMEHFGVEPDITTLAKGIANGLPLGATIAKADIMDWHYGAHTSTFGGNPVACRAAMGVLSELRGGVLQNCETVGTHLQEQLRSLQGVHPSIAEVRGLGLMIGVELSSDRTTRAESTELRDFVVRRSFENGLLLLGCGRSALRIVPPLIISEAEIAQGITILDRVLTEAEATFGIREPERWKVIANPAVQDEIALPQRER